MSWEATILELLSASLLRPFILAAVAVLVLRVFRVEHPASKHAVWTIVLTGMLLIPLLSVMLPHLDFEALPQGTLSRFSPLDEPHRQLQFLADAGTGAVPEPASSAASVVTTIREISTSIESSSVSKRITSGKIVLWIYSAGLLGFAFYRLIGWLLMRRLISRSRPFASGVLRESDDVTVPIAVGILKPTVILPAEWRQWTPADRRAILAHEFAHLRRRDTAVSALSRVTKCLFWFHPLSWWIAGRISELAEMACDAAALQRVSDAAAYSKVLVDFARVVSQRRHRATLPGLAMANRSRLSRRIEQIFAVANGRRRRLVRPGVVLTAVGIPCLGISATLGLTEAAARPLRHVQQTVTEKIESVAQLAKTSGVLAAIAEAVPPIATPQEPAQSASTAKAFVDQYCVSCHSVKARSGGLVLENQDLNQVRNNAAIWEKVVRRLRSGLEPKAGVVAVPLPDPATVRNVVGWLESELDRDAMPYMPAPGPHRLNRTEYGNAVHDLLGLDVNPALLLPADNSQYGFDNIAKSLQMTAALNAAYGTAAERIAELAMSNTNSRTVLFACRPDNNEEDIACAQQFITTFGARAFRRPPADSEVSTLMDLYKTKASVYFNSRYFDAGIQAVLTNILADSRFLNRTEVEPANVPSGQTYRISDLELASRLSYFLWSRAPDDQLMDIANRGQLSNPTILEQETRRMLKDPRAEALTVNFAEQWLWLRGLQRVGPMPLYPEFDEDLQQAMKREVELFFASIVQEDRNVVDLLTANYTFLNERLARHYGISNVYGNDFRRVDLGPAFDVRRGVLGKAAVLTLTSRPDRTSLTARAKWVLSSLLGVYPPDPPPNVPAMRPKTAPMREIMEREEQYSAACASCHRMIDPIGIVLDNFDQAGKWRTEDNSITINPATELVDGTPLKGPADLRSTLVARSNQFVQTLTEKLLTYSLGRGLSYQDMPQVRAIARDAARDNNRFSAIVVGIVKSPAFQMNSKS